MSDDQDDVRDDLDDGLKFLHRMGMQTKKGVLSHRAMVDALTELLVSTGKVSREALAKRLEEAQSKEIVRLEDHVHLKIYDNVDKYQVAEPEIDCISRIPLCKARCCKMFFSLSRQDLNERVVQWDYNNPYMIRHGADGYCVHNARGESGGCTVYEQRPAVCRGYTCKNDKRIWKDFDARIPAEFKEGPELPDDGAPALRKQLR